MQGDFHYNATYCAAYLAGYTAEESETIAYSAQFVDYCSQTLLNKLKAPAAAATTQLSLEMMNHRMDIIGLQSITRIWSSFHFLPRDLYADCGRKSKAYKSKFRLICGPNGSLVKDTVELAKGRTLQAVGVAMHVLADTWAHRNFAGTPSLVINNVASDVYEITPEGKKKISFVHNASAPDNFEKSIYTSSLYQMKENTVMNLGHGRAGHLPDYSFIRYEYMPAWGDYELELKDNPKEYYNAFCQMIYAMKYLRGEIDSFETEKYAFDAAAPYEQEIKAILEKRQLIAGDDWNEFGRKLTGRLLEPFDINRHQPEYISAADDMKDSTFLGSFIIAAMGQKSMVTNRIFRSKNYLSGYSVDYSARGFRGIKDFSKLVKAYRGGDGK